MKVFVGVLGAEMSVLHVTSPPSVESTKPSSGRLLMSSALYRRGFATGFVLVVRGSGSMTFWKYGAAEGLVVMMDDVLGRDGCLNSKDVSRRLQ